MEPLRTLEDAEQFYRECGCSHFHMGREHPERYDEYMALGIPEATEHAWMRAECEERLAELFRVTEPCSLTTPTWDRVWAKHNAVATFIERLRAPDLLRQFEAVTRHLVPLVPDRDRVLVAENIVGRGVREPDAPLGPIRLARSLGELDAAASLVALVPAFLDGTQEMEYEGVQPLAERKGDVLRRLRALSEAAG